MRAGFRDRRIVWRAPCHLRFDFQLPSASRRSKPAVGRPAMPRQAPVVRRGRSKKAGRGVTDRVGAKPPGKAEPSRVSVEAVRFTAAGRARPSSSDATSQFGTFAALISVLRVGEQAPAGVVTARCSQPVPRTVGGLGGLHSGVAWPNRRGAAGFKVAASGRLACRLFGHPAQRQVLAKSPVAAESEAGDLPFLIIL